MAARNTDILDLNLNDFYNIISDDELNTREEDYVWKLCVKWIDRDPENRKQHVAHLMTGVRLGLMTPKVSYKDNPNLKITLRLPSPRSASWRRSRSIPMSFSAMQRSR